MNFDFLVRNVRLTQLVPYLPLGAIARQATCKIREEAKVVYLGDERSAADCCRSPRIREDRGQVGLLPR